jgi:hypothetical protein
MIRPASDRTVLGWALAQIAQLARPYDSKTDQTDHTDQRSETAEEFGAPPEPELTSCPAELTNGTAELPGSRNQSS